MPRKVELLEKLLEEAVKVLGPREAAKLLAFAESYHHYDRVLFVILFSLLLRPLEKDEMRVIICDEE